MWLTSNTPARSRTAACSSRMPVYWMGMSHPAELGHLGVEGEVAVVERGRLEGHGDRGKGAWEGTEAVS